MKVIAISKLVQGLMVLAIHAGGNDLCSVHLAEFISIIRSDINHLAAFFHNLIRVYLGWCGGVPGMLLSLLVWFIHIFMLLMPF